MVNPSYKLQHMSYWMAMAAFKVNMSHRFDGSIDQAMRHMQEQIVGAARKVILVPATELESALRDTAQIGVLIEASETATTTATTPSSCHKDSPAR